MLPLNYDTKSDYTVRLPNPNKRQDIFSSGKTFVTYDQTRPLEEQLPFTAWIADLLQEAAVCEQQRREGEEQRAVASEEIKDAHQRLRKLVRIMRKTLDAAFPETPTKAKGWGFKVKQSTAKILLPQTPEEHLNVADAYIVKELSRPEADRFTSPHLTDVIAVRNAVAEKVALRDAGQNQRETAIAQSNAIAAELYDHLQGAASHLMSFRYNYTITPELQNWGYVVVTRRSAGQNGDDKTAANGSTNDTAANGTPTNGSAANGSSEVTLDTVTDGLLTP
ncbi:MAG: hypothetical protein H6632_15320 [Anaerolineales bacterium]|nr:hypothetical protein [Anaerolineales bacterium]